MQLRSRNPQSPGLQSTLSALTFLRPGLRPRQSGWIRKRRFRFKKHRVGGKNKKMQSEGCTLSNWTTTAGQHRPPSCLFVPTRTGHVTQSKNTSSKMASFTFIRLGERFRGKKKKLCFSLHKKRRLLDGKRCVFGFIQINVGVFRPRLLIVRIRI